LFRGLARAVDDLGEAAANLAMVVYAGKAEVLEWQVPKLPHRLVDANIAVFDLL